MRGEEFIHFILGVECFDHAEAGKGFLNVGQNFAHLVLPFLGALFQGLSHFTDQGTHDG